MLARALVTMALVWPAIAGGAVWQRVSAPDRPATWAAVVYLAGSLVCHQKTERSFATSGVSWPVCARCAGLYLVAPFAAVVAFTRRPSLRRRMPGRAAWLIAVVPTALTLMWEWGGLGATPNALRFATALPLGAMVTWVLVVVADSHRPVESIG